MRIFIRHAFYWIFEQSNLTFSIVFLLFLTVTSYIDRVTFSFEFSFFHCRISLLKFCISKIQHLTFHNTDMFEQGQFALCLQLAKTFHSDLITVTFS